MNAFPIVGRELLSVARKPATHRIRLGVSMVGFAGVFGLLWLSPVSGSERGRQLYMVVSGLALLWALVAGVLLTADAINEERDRGTLGLLFLTDLRPHDILLGKLAARSLNGAYALIGLVPILAVPLAFGGVTAWQVFGHSVLAIETLVLSMCVGLYASTRWSEPGVAMARGVAIMVAISLLPPFLVAITPGGWQMRLALGGPLSAYVILLSRRLAVFPAEAFLTGAIMIGLLAATFFFAAARRLKREDALDSPAPSPQTTDPWGRPRTQVFGKASKPPAGLIETDPIMWLLWRRNQFPRADRTFLTTVLLIGLPLGVAAFTGSFGWWPVLWIAFILQWAMTSHMVSQSCKRIGSEEDRSALELLMTTPRAASGTLESYHRAFQQLFQTQFWWLAGVYGVLILAAVVAIPSTNRAWILLPTVALFVLFAERYAASWVGLNASLRHARYHRALLTVQLCVHFPTWGSLAAIILMIPLQMVPVRNWWTAYASWILFGGLLPWMVGAWHRRKAVRWLRDHGT